MAIFESLTNTLKALAIGERVKVTLRPEIGRFPNPMEGHITQKDESGNFSLKSEHGVVQVSASDILAIMRLQRWAHTKLNKKGITTATKPASTSSV